MKLLIYLKQSSADMIFIWA